MKGPTNFELQVIQEERDREEAAAKADYIDGLWAHYRQLLRFIVSGNCDSGAHYRRCCLELLDTRDELENVGECIGSEDEIISEHGLNF